MLYDFIKNLDWIEVLSIFLDKGIDLIVIVIFGYIIIRIIDFLIDKFFDKTNFDRAVEQFIHNLTVWMLWLILLLFVLGYLGVDIGPILASLSIVGFITGFALKDVLANLAAGLLILATKPFKIGDMIKSGEVFGKVEKIGIASCELTTPDNLKITIPNATLWGNAIYDYNEYDTRRISIIIGVSYSNELKKVFTVIKNILKSEKKVLLKPEHQVLVANLGNDSVDIKINAWVKLQYIDDVTDSLNKKIKYEFEKHKIEFGQQSLNVNLIK
ncbi:MAG: mechanosensitive ion channel family protein [archaeon]